jgi:ribokinase
LIQEINYLEQNRRMNLKRIIVIGSANTDMVVKTEKLPLPGETKLGGTFFMHSGGKGANQAVAVARMGGDVTFVTKIGNDIFGKQTLEGLEKENINTEFVLVDENQPSGVALIIVNDEGENCIVVAPGANAMLLPEDIRFKDVISETEIILMQLEIPIKTVSEVLQKAKSINKRVILNPAPAQQLDDDLLLGLYMITPNESEARLLTGIKVHDEETALKAADILISKGVKNVVITMGASGAFVRTDAISKLIPVKQVTAIDSTGAGDVFNGALAVAILEEMPIEDAVAYAHKASAISVTRMGAQSSIPYKNEII